MNKKLLVIQVCLLLTMLAIMPVKAQEDLAKKSQNPIGNMISLPFENNTYTEAGPSDKIGNVLNIKPVYPVNLGKINLINRLVVPLIYLEGQDRKDVPARRSRRRAKPVVKRYSRTRIAYSDWGIFSTRPFSHRRSPARQFGVLGLLSNFQPTRIPH